MREPLRVLLDVDPALGRARLTGHLVLADALRELGGSCRFVVRGHASWPERHVVEAGFECARVAEGDVTSVLEVLGDVPPDVIVTDAGEHGAWWLDAAPDLPTVELDDLGVRVPVAGAAWVPPSSDGLVPTSGEQRARSRTLSGPRYALVERPFARAERYAFRDEVSSVGLFLGGEGGAARGAGVAAALRSRGFVARVVVAAEPDDPTLDPRPAADGSRSTVVLRPVDRAGFFAAHDIQVGSADAAAWQRACIGAPSLTVAVDPDQRRLLTVLDELGLVEAGADASADAVARAVLALAADPRRRRELAGTCRALVDGRGAERVACAILATRMDVRRASLADASLLFRWRNHPRTRSVSRTSAPIPFDSHRAWLADTLGRSDRLLLVASAGAREVGVVRFDLDLDLDGVGDEVEVSIYLDPETAGLGLGAAVLGAGETELARTLTRPATLTAEVLDGNEVSRRLFVRSGYVAHGGRFVKAILPARG